MTTVSLIVPSYRRGAKIAPTLSSIVAQTRPPDEVIVVNDGGWDETTDFVRTHYPSFRVIDVEQGGACLSRNRGAAAAAHPVLMFLDDDDTLLPDATATLLRVLNTFPAARAAYADHTYTNRITGEFFPNHHSANHAFHRLKNVTPLGEREGVRLYGRALYEAMLSGNLLQQPWMIYKEYFSQLGGFRPGLYAANDWELYLRVTRAAPIALSDHIISNHIVEAGRPHLTLSPKLAQAQMEAARVHLDLVGYSDYRALVVLRRKLALYYKGLGDQERPVSIRRAWSLYVRSLACWPFDSAVIARIGLWPLEALGARVRSAWPRF